MRNYDAARDVEAQGGENPPVGSFASGEYVSVSPSTNLDLIKLTLPPFIRRRIYLYIEAKLTVTGADYYVLAEIEFRKNGQVRCVLPANIGRDASPDYLKDTLVSCFANPIAGGQNSIQVTFSTAFAGGEGPAALNSPGSAFITPFEIDVSADEAILRIKGLAQKNTPNKPDIRAWLGVLSMSQ